MSADGPSRTATAWLIDCHVHFHPSFQPAAFIDAALAAFRRASGGAEVIGALCIADARGQRGFERLKHSRGDWDIVGTAEATSFLIGRGSDVLAVVAGRQAATAERLEVLQLGSAGALPDGEPLAPTLARARVNGGLAVVPWGFGKWSFARGRLVRELIERGDGTLVLGDTGNRSAAFRAHAALRAARARGIPILPGSDPLPVPSHATRAGSCGVRVACVPDLDFPTQQLLALLAQRTQPETFCTRSTLPRVVADQIAIRMPRAGAGRSGA
jgi:hypothetical protein